METSKTKGKHKENIIPLPLIDLILNVFPLPHYGNMKWNLSNVWKQNDSY